MRSWPSPKAKPRTHFVLDASRYRKTMKNLFTGTFFGPPGWVPVPRLLLHVELAVHHGHRTREASDFHLFGRSCATPAVAWMKSLFSKAAVFCTTHHTPIGHSWPDTNLAILYRRRHLRCARSRHLLWCQWSRPAAAWPSCMTKLRRGTRTQEAWQWSSVLT